MVERCKTTELEDSFTDIKNFRYLPGHSRYNDHSLFFQHKCNFLFGIAFIDSKNRAIRFNYSVDIVIERELQRPHEFEKKKQP